MTLTFSLTPEEQAALDAYCVIRRITPEEELPRWIMGTIQRLVLDQRLLLGEDLRSRYVLLNSGQQNAVDHILGR